MAAGVARRGAGTPRTDGETLRVDSRIFRVIPEPCESAVVHCGLNLITFAFCCVSGSGLLGQRMTHARGGVRDSLPSGLEPVPHQDGRGGRWMPFKCRQRWRSPGAVRCADTGRWRRLATQRHALTRSAQQRTQVGLPRSHEGLVGRAPRGEVGAAAVRRPCRGSVRAPAPARRLSWHGHEWRALASVERGPAAAGPGVSGGRAP
jgi:hypothetical protein